MHVTSESMCSWKSDTFSMPIVRTHKSQLQAPQVQDNCSWYCSLDLQSKEGFPVSAGKCKSEFAPLFLLLRIPSFYNRFFSFFFFLRSAKSSSKSGTNWPLPKGLTCFSKVNVFHDPHNLSHLHALTLLENPDESWDWTEKSERMNYRAEGISRGWISFAGNFLPIFLREFD